MSIHAVVNSHNHAEWAMPNKWGIGRPMHRYILWFGVYADTRVLVYADSLESALEDAAQELREQGWIGLFTEPDYADALEDLQKEGKIPQDVTWEEISACGVIDEVSEKVLSRADADLTYTESGWIASWEWGIVAEDPSREELLDIAHSECHRRLDSDSRKYDYHDHTRYGIEKIKKAVSS